MEPKALETKSNFTYSIIKFKDIKNCIVKINGYYSDHKGVNQVIEKEYKLKIEKTKLPT